MSLPTTSGNNLRLRIRTELLRIVRSYVVMASVLVTLVVGIATAINQRDENDHHRQLVLTKLGTEVSNVAHELEALGTSPLLWTGLTDSMGREAYLAPLLAQFNRASLRQFVVLDYRGRVFLGSEPGPAAELAGSAPVAEAVRKGTTTVGLLPAMEGPPDLVLVQRVLAPQTDTPVGFIVARVNTGRLASQLELPSGSRVSIALGDQPPLPPLAEGLLLSSTGREQVRASNFKVDLRVWVFCPVTDALLIIAGVVLTAFMLGLWNIRRVVAWADQFSASTTQRLDQLLVNCQKLLAGEPVSQLDESEPDELSEVNRALATMLRQQRKAADEMRTTALVFSTAAEGILVTDPQGHILDANPAFCRMTGYGRNELLGRRSGSLYRQVGRGDQSREMARALKERGRWSGETNFVDRHGNVIPTSVAISAIRDEDGTTSGHVAVITDVSRLKEAENQLRTLAFRDALTGLPNFRLLTRQARELLNALPLDTGRLAVLFFDVDQLKFVNDNHGHEAGDALIKGIAERIRTILPPGHLLCRRSGDEFLAVVDLTPEGATAALRAALEHLNPVMVPFAHDQIPATATVGIARLPEDGRSWHELQICADVAMNEAKQTRRGSVMWYDAVLGAKRYRHRLIQTKLTQAIEQGVLQVHYQPEVDLRTGAIVGFEALARWTDPELGVISPAEFIPISEDSHLSDKLTLLVAARVLSDKKHLQARYPGAKVAFNAAPQVFRNADLLQFLTDQAASDPQAMDGLEIELTETQVARDEASLMPQLQILKALGVRLVIDDFGTGYSSLARLTPLPISRLKIDRSFVAGLSEERQDRIARLIVNMAHGLDLEVTAEGLEEAAQREALLGMGCHRGQGWLFAPALPLADVLLLSEPLEAAVEAL